MRPNYKLNRNKQIFDLFNEGYPSVKIAKKFKISKQRVRQILNSFNIEPRKLIGESRENKLKIAKEAYDNGLGVKQTVSIFNMSRYEMELFRDKYDSNFLPLKEIQENNKKRNKELYKLYKKGLTANEILKMFPKYKNINTIYNFICQANNGHLPKRISTYIKSSNDLTNKIIKLKKKHTFNDVHKILVDNGVKNAYNQPLRLQTVLSRYYKKNNK